MGLKKMKGMNFPFVIKPLFTIIYLLLIAVAMIVFLGRSYDALKMPFWGKEFYSHISNFTIAYLITSVVGFLWLQQGVQISRIIIFAIVVLLVNYLYELWLPIINTPDIIDGHFGAAGVLLATIFLVIVARSGLMPNPNFVPPAKRQ